MRTTLDLEDDIYLAAKEMARREDSSAGKIISRLVREALLGAKVSAQSSLHAINAPSAAFGFEPFPAQGVVIGDEAINQLRDEEGV